MILSLGFKDEKGFSNLIILLIVAALLCVGVIAVFFTQSEKTTVNKVDSTLLEQPTPSPLPSASPWKTYTNDQYGFEITYPAQGVVVNTDGWAQGMCGQAIKTDPKDKDTILVDNFFKIKIIDFKGGVKDYLVTQGASRAYETAIIASSSAQEAVALGDLKKGVEYARGFPPLVYTKALFKKGEKLFVMTATQFPNNFGGCISPEFVDANKFPEEAKLDWDMTQSLKFK